MNKRSKQRPKLTLFLITELIDARGSGEPQAVSLMFQDVLSRLLSNDSSTISQSITYPAGFDQNVTSGVQETVSIIKSGLEQCPDQKYHLFGYSQGATLVQSALQELEGDKQAMNAIKNVVVVGNPYRIPGRKANVDSHGHRDNRTVYGLFATQALERQANASFPAFSTALDGSGKISDICLEVSFFKKTFPGAYQNTANYFACRIRTISCAPMTQSATASLPVTTCRMV